MKITRQLFDAFIRCRFKLHLLATDQEGVAQQYGELLEDLDRKYRDEAILRLQRRFGADRIISNPASIVDAQIAGPELMLEIALVSNGFSVDSLVLTKISNDGCLGKPEYAPTLFVHREKINRWDKLLISFHALALSDVLGDLPTFGTIIHGQSAKTTKVKFKTQSGMTAVLRDARRAAGEIRKQIETKPPALTLNSHCTTCEFKDRCNADARAADDISLLRSLSVGEIDAFRERGVFTVQQLSYTFRTKSVTGKRSAKDNRFAYVSFSRGQYDARIYTNDTSAQPQSR